MVAVEFLGKEGESGGRRQKAADQVQAPPDIRTGELPRAGLQIDIAAEAVHIKSERVVERLTYVVPQYCAVLRWIRLPAHEFLFELPAPFVDFSMGSIGEFLGSWLNYHLSLFQMSYSCFVFSDYLYTRIAPKFSFLLSNNASLLVKY